MNYVIILAAGFGSRFKNFKIPKQFLYLSKTETILSLSIKKFLLKEVDEILVVANKNFLKNTEKIINKVIEENKDWKINICVGGTTRNESLQKGISWLNKNKILKDKDILLTHDAARPFVDKEIILKNIKLTKKYGACSTGIKSIDTIAKLSKDVIANVLNRDEHILEQTPQTFNWKIAKNVYLNANKKLLSKYTDACGLLKHFNYKIGFVLGSSKNIKITNEIDLKIAKLIYKTTKYNFEF